jgi:hypothetical protein
VKLLWSRGIWDMGWVIASTLGAHFHPALKNFFLPL